MTPLGGSSIYAAWRAQYLPRLTAQAKKLPPEGGSSGYKKLETESRKEDK